MPNSNTEIQRALRALYYKDNVVEIRSFDKNGARFVGRYPCGPDLIAAIASEDAQGRDVYYVANPTNMGPAPIGSNQGTREKDIARRRWILLDFDPIRKYKIATSEQYGKALAQALAAREFMAAEGWHDIVLASSGNGVHLLIPIDLPNDDQAKLLVRKVQRAVADRFETGEVEIECFPDANRLIRAYGTVNHKADETETLKWRKSGVISAPEAPPPPVTREQLEAFTVKYPLAEPERKPTEASSEAGSFTYEILEERLAAWAERHPKFTYVPGRVSKGDGRGFYIMCPGDFEGGWGDGAEHSDRIGKPNGSMAVWVENGFPRFRCGHNHCDVGAKQGKKTWKHLQEYFDPGRKLHSLTGNPSVGGTKRPDVGTVQDDTAATLRDGSKRAAREQKALEAADVVIGKLAASKAEKRTPELALIASLYEALADIEDETAGALKLGQAAELLWGKLKKKHLEDKVAQIRAERRQKRAAQRQQEQADEAEAERAAIDEQVREERREEAMTEARRRHPEYDDQLVASAGEVLLRQWAFQAVREKVPYSPAEMSQLGLGAPYRTLLGPETTIDIECAVRFLNRKIAYVRDPGEVVDLSRMEVMDPEDINGAKIKHWHEMTVDGFKSHHFATYYYHRPTPTSLTKPLAGAWIGSPLRREYPKMTYAPGKPLEHGGMLNRWLGWGCEPAEGDITPFIELLTHLMPIKEERDFFWQILACPLQQPGVKMTFAPVLQSIQQGVGKNLIFEPVVAIYGKNGKFVNERQIHGSDFNYWQCDAQFIVGDEIGGVDRMARREIVDFMKTLITDKALEIRRKYLPPLNYANHVNYAFLSNHIDAVFIEDHDRRFWVPQVTQERKSPEFYAAYAAWAEKGAPALFYYLLHRVSLEGFNPHGPAPLTTAKEIMIENARGRAAEWAHEIRTNRQNALRINADKNLFTIDELMTAFKIRYILEHLKEGPVKVREAVLGAGFKFAAGARQCPTKTAGKSRIFIMTDDTAPYEGKEPHEIGAMHDAERAKEIEVAEGINEAIK